MFTLVTVRFAADGVTSVRGQYVAARLSTVRRFIAYLTAQRPGLIWRIHEDSRNGGWIDASSPDAWSIVGAETPRGEADILRDY